MSAELQRNNPLHGLKTEKLLTELVEYYGWKILFAATRFNCFKVNPTLEGSLKFLQKTEWARTKLEDFYLYRFTRMPKPNEEEYHLAPRERSFAHGIVPRTPMKLTIESIELSQAKSASAFQDRQDEKRDRRHSTVSTKHPYRDANVKRSTKHDKSKDQPEANYDPSNPWNI